MDSGVPYYFQTNPKGHHQTSHACVLKITATIFVTAVADPRASDTRTHVLKEKTSDGMSTPTRSRFMNDAPQQVGTCPITLSISSGYPGHLK
jgi:hypothetical protein